MKRTLLLGLTAAAVVLLAAPFLGGAGGELAFTLAAAALPVLLMALGAARARSVGRLAWALWLLALVLGGSLFGMWALAGRVVDGPWLLGLPLAAALQILGLFGLPAIVVALAYGLGFDRHGVRTEDLERLRSLRGESRDSPAPTEQGTD